MFDSIPLRYEIKPGIWFSNISYKSGDDEKSFLNMLMNLLKNCLFAICFAICSNNNCPEDIISEYITTNWQDGARIWAQIVLALIQRRYI
jgi:hypothetical protein